MRKLLERLYNLLLTENSGEITTQKWVYNALTAEERNNFTTIIDKDFIYSIIDASWFIEDVCKKFHQTYNDKGNEFMFLTTIHYVKNGFGFSNYGNVFCHATKYNNPANYEQDCKYNHFVVEAEKSPKGLSAKNIILLDSRLDNPVNDELDEIIADATMETFRDNAVRKLRIIEENKKAAAERAKKIALRDKAITELVGKYEKEVIEEWNHHGGYKKYEFWFEQEIDKDTFVKFLELLNLPTVAKPCYAPISPEKVEFYPITKGWPMGMNPYGLPPKQGWSYKWMGEWDD